jgi:DNA-binding NarL/FixJ family response regulator
MQTLRILVADDHAAVRRSICSLLASRAEWTVSEAADGEEAVEQARRLQPDVVLLDLSMPKLNGLEVARRIRQEFSATHVFILTMHGSDQLAEEAHRAGADGLISKSDAHRSLIPAIDSLRYPRTAIHLAGGVVDEFLHIGAFFRSEEERYRILVPFIAEGLARGEKAVHIIDPPDRGMYVRQLTERGIDVPGAEARRQLRLLPWTEAYLREGKFDKQAMLTLLQERLTEGSAEGFSRTRAIAYMEWALQDRPGVTDLVEYEGRLNDVLPRFNDVVICAYDVTKFPGDLIDKAMRTHPAVIVDGLLKENASYSPRDIVKAPQ